ncbi:hypothetical protein DFQ30_006260 [Apophysomyces sp. BC1015]|nr:hypothetical protein DFQ30_006260 [Apophysomyces sp. BC1015]
MPPDELHLQPTKEEVMKPDYISFVSPVQRRLYVFTIEAKAPKKEGRSDSGTSDLVKLGKEMKKCIDAMVKAGVDDPVCGGLLVQGYRLQKMLVRSPEKIAS